MKKTLFVLAGVLVVASMLLAACQPKPTPTPTAAPATEAPTQAPTEAPTQPAAGKVQIRWFVGLGTGTNPDQVAVQQEVVNDFNASQDKIELVLEVVPYDSARDTLSTEIASGNGPDIVGPVGWGGTNFFYGQWLDLAPLIQETGYDVSQFDPGLVKAQVTTEGQLGLPFAVFPAAVYYVPKMFDEAGLNYPPAKYGDKYVMPDGTEKPWDWNTVAEIARLLTLDANGKNATEAGFDRNSIVQVGYVPQWQHAMHMAGFWGAGAADFFDADHNAIIPEPAKQAWTWYFNGIWGDQPFIANGALAGSPEFGAGNVFNAGKAAMAVTHFWYTCCLADFKNAGNEFQLGVLPANPNDGKVHGRVDADTFRIWKGTQHPKEAFEVLTYLVGPAVKKLAPTYGALPARAEDQQPFLDAKSADYPFVKSWQPLLDGLAYPDVPSAEGWMPNLNEAWNRVGAFGDLMANDGTIDLAQEIEKLRQDLDVIFKK